MSLSQNESPLVLENPFFHRGPIWDRCYFFGRIRETRRALEMLRRGQCISIVGPRRIGKTSLLFHLRAPEVRKEHSLGGNYLLVYVDCQGLRDLDKSEFYQWLWEETRRALPEQGEADAWAKRAIDFKEFRDAMIAVQEEGYQIVFLFDEFESIAKHPNLDQNLFSDLRSLVPTIIYATASRDSLYDLTYTDRSVLSSPFFNVFEEIPLGFLKPNEVEGKPHEAEEMISGLLKISKQENLFIEKDFTFVFKAGGYFPFFIQLVCYCLFARKMECEELSEADYESVRQQYAVEAKPHFRYIWTNLDADEQKAVRLVCAGRSGQISEEQRRSLKRKYILYGSAIFSEVFTEFVQGQMTVAGTKEAHEVETKGEIREKDEAAVSEEIPSAEANVRSRESEALDALLTVFFFGGLFAMVLALVANYTLLFWLAGFLELVLVIVLLVRFVLSRRSHSGS